MTDQDEDQQGFQQFTKDVLYSALVSVTATVLVRAALLLAAAVIALVIVGWSVPAWTLAVMALLSLLFVYLTRRVVGREATELGEKVGEKEDELDRHESYGKNICECLETFQKIIAKDVKMTMSDFIEQGILIPGRDVMQANGRPSDLRMSVLMAVDDNFEMIWASGHSVESKQKYRVPIADTIAKLAFESKTIQVWKDAPSEERAFVKNPKATRVFRSMVSIPILLGGTTAGVFNIVTSEASAFDPADVNYLTSLGSIIQLAFGVAVKERRAVLEAKEAKEAASQQRQATKRAIRGKANFTPLRAQLPQPDAPQRGVRSPDTSDGMEASDE